MAWRSPDKLGCGVHGTNNGRILVRMKWSGQLVPRCANFWASTEFTKRSTSGRELKCPIRRCFGETRPRTNEKIDRKSTRLNSSHSQISYAVFCLKKKKAT